MREMLPKCLVGGDHQPGSRYGRECPLGREPSVKVVEQRRNALTKARAAQELGLRKKRGRP